MTARRGLVMLAVLLVVAMAALVAVTIVASGGATRDHADAALRRDEARSVAWSGVRIALAELAEQRDQVLRGESPELTRRAELYRTATGERAVVVLIPVAGDDPSGRATPVASPEAARLNLNASDAGMLARVEGVSQTTADAIVEARKNGPFASVAEAAARGSVDLNAAAGLLTAVSSDPELAVGVGDDANTGEPRTDLAANPDAIEALLREELEAAVVDQAVEALAGATVGSLPELIDLLEAQQVPRGRWGRILDRVRFGDAEHAVGRIDLLRAPEAVLAAVPGVSADAARSLVSARDRLSEDERRAIAWPLTTGVLALEDFRLAAPHLAARSTQWRFRVRAGFAPAGDDDTRSAAELRDEALTDRLSSRVEWEVIVDAGEQPPRLAMLKDVTLEGAWALVRAERGTAGEPESSGAPAPMSMPEPATGATPPADGPGTPPQATAPRVGRWLASGRAG